MGSVRHMLWALTFGSEEECKYFKELQIEPTLEFIKNYKKK
jgi:hypothetical protein